MSINNPGRVSGGTGRICLLFIPEQFFRLKGSIDEVYAAYNESKEKADA